jgi:hydroxyethylthiazole kinase-like uncharacterized protein yjeF
MKVVTVEEMRRLEQRSQAAGISTDVLMEAAGLTVARTIAELLDGIRGKRVLVLVGPGNNGGDGLVTARYLSDWGALVTLYMTTASRGREDKFEECRSRRMRVVEAREDPDQLALSSYLSLTDLVLDAVLGIGNDRPLEDHLRAIFQSLQEVRAHQPGLRLVALDLPTGLDADTGAVDEMCPPADLTVTLSAPKVGMFRFPGADYVGRLETVDIGMPKGVDDDVALELMDDRSAAALLPPRPLNSYKGKFGRLLIVAGSQRYVGAAVLSCTGAYRAGAGLVTLATPTSVYRLAASQAMEPVFLPLDETATGEAASTSAAAIRDALEEADAGVLGPGLGGGESVRELVQQVLLVEPTPHGPLVLDADALNALAKLHGWWEQLQTPAVLTPHPGELARLLRCSAVDVEADRLAAAQSAAERWRHVVVLKGAHTIVAAADGRTSISPFANPALASGGTGDVLAGIIGSLMAQGSPPYEAATAGVYLHGAAGERVRREIGDAGLLASDLLPKLPRVMKHLREIG